MSFINFVRRVYSTFCHGIQFEIDHGHIGQNLYKTTAFNVHFPVFIQPEDVNQSVSVGSGYQIFRKARTKSNPSYIGTSEEALIGENLQQMLLDSS